MSSNPVQDLLQSITRQGRWLLTHKQVQVMHPNEHEESLRGLISRYIKTGKLVQVTDGLYAVASAEQSQQYKLEQIIPYLRPLWLNYISAESALDEEGVLKRPYREALTVMTTGQSQIYETRYGVIEFTHTDRDVSALKSECRFDRDREIYVAPLSLAIQDLRQLARNSDLVDQRALSLKHASDE